jgi:hypothetical protein
VREAATNIKIIMDITTNTSPITPTARRSKSYLSASAIATGSRQDTVTAMHNWCREHHAELRAHGFQYLQYPASYRVFNKRYTITVNNDCTLTVDRHRSKLQVTSERQSFDEWCKLLLMFKQVLSNLIEVK